MIICGPTRSTKVFTAFFVFFIVSLRAVLGAITHPALVDARTLEALVLVLFTHIVDLHEFYGVF